MIRGLSPIPRGGGIPGCPAKCPQFAYAFFRYFAGDPDGKEGVCITTLGAFRTIRLNERVTATAARVRASAWFLQTAHGVRPRPRLSGADRSRGETDTKHCPRHNAGGKYRGGATGERVTASAARVRASACPDTRGCVCLFIYTISCVRGRLNTIIKPARKIRKNFA